MSENKRNRRFVDAQVQGALVRRTLIHWCVFFAATLVASVILHVLTQPLLDGGSATQTFLERYGLVFLLLIVMLPVFVIDTIKMSNRFAGPVRRLRTNLMLLAAGEPGELLDFREDDYWQELAQNYNRVRERLLEADARPATAEPVVSSTETGA